jgi:hypothetical protein
MEDLAAPLPPVPRVPQVIEYRCTQGQVGDHGLRVLILVQAEPRAQPARPREVPGQEPTGPREYVDAARVVEHRAEWQHRSGCFTRQPGIQGLECKPDGRIPRTSQIGR